MKGRALVAALALVAAAGPAHALPSGAEGSTSPDGLVTVGVVISAPGVGVTGQPGDDALRPIVHYTISWSVDPTPAQTGSLNGLCLVAGSNASLPVFGFLYHLVGSDASGTIVDDRFECVPFPSGDTTGRPPVPPVPAVPTYGEAWSSARLPAPRVTLDPPGRGITGLDTRITTSGPTSLTISATLRGFTITGTAVLDHYTISVDGDAIADAGAGHYIFETKGTYLVSVGAVWRASASLTGPGLRGGLPVVDLGRATITSTRVYAVHEIRSVLRS